MKAAAAVAFLATAVHAAAVYPTYEIPAFDVQVGSEAPSLVAALKATGLVALKNIPDYTTTRAAYLQAAAECVSASHENVIHKRLIDGTQRRTLSTHADTDLIPDSLVEACPDYVAALKKFNGVIDQAGLAFARALDASSDSIQNHAVETVVTKGKNLEHLHSYAASTADDSIDDSGNHLSLERHTDSGLFILMSAPTFFDASNRPVANPDTNAGLLVMLNGTDFRPVQKDDELVVMVGQGFNEWTDLGHRFPPVLHAMVMPRSSEPVNRLFFGRMVLLPEESIMANTNTTFQEYAASTKRFLLGQDVSTDIATFACPIHRQLQASDPSCTIGIWAPSSDSPANVTKAMCMRDCNVENNPDMQKDKERCVANKCVKTSEVANGGTVCWMFSDDVCPSKTATCVDDSLVCQGGTVAPKPVTTTAAPIPVKSAAASSILSALAVLVVSAACIIV
ncbi:hypothetical protein DYB32_007341 [Aphanomyces invadans]|uniref:Fe2OG dioxygenase domain-containing protein n=1 Tax=Aphanomyces invadans TaxID=157072 RepID=A0A3R6WI68_9STRA|nr:hypothetical protein DYB32_007341 [Aphanomyces invadans]